MPDNHPHTRVILEMLGAPKDYIEQTLHNYVAKIKKEGIKVTKEHYEPAQPANKLFSTFAELEITFPSISELLTFCFEALPSSVEITEPSTLILPTPLLNGFLNDLQARLHEADLRIKNTSLHNKILETNTSAIFNNFIITLIRQQAHTLESLATAIGIAHKELQPFLTKLIEAKKIILTNTTYTLPP